MQKQAEIEKRIQKRIPRSLHRSNFRGSEFFEGFNLSKIQFPEKRKTSKSKRALCWKIFNDCFELIINDVIDNNIIFEFPSKVRALIGIGWIEGDHFKTAYTHGYFPGIDFLKTNFRGPRLFLTTWDKNGEKNIPIFETKKNVLLDRMIKNANDGKYY